MICSCTEDYYSTVLVGPPTAYIYVTGYIVEVRSVNVMRRTHHRFMTYDTYTHSIFIQEGGRGAYQLIEAQETPFFSWRALFVCCLCVFFCSWTIRRYFYKASTWMLARGPASPAQDLHHHGPDLGISFFLIFVRCVALRNLDLLIKTSGVGT